ncbi:hypothetical protein NIES2135_61170 (plasmid) [Leptolyngbya boryana NIES-2135]|jgi:hypothetical protein|uniref:Restriction endonuclease type IV Mrr domain-containing protein n=1 Tax=Leptolyngbya boryana NIES-2135 TaxID=1973484 RepID=A0A1Z4JRA4_LEPBY|nr:MULTISPECIES: hypothetical protein [Leptolyngbya]BAY59240.1 hypothetical protein NIES2135_61170 [Leptolyngbya boryana NIES-2135]MBD2372831.1 hypothetical protein [Leptolyngbya sp. FACHB-238]MBD2397416.1 hypothetical protein [Leptolyngbya sp. FACHB-239]MBD2403779.1 hypothetical protein [Leptolyngbya sp. FACHB-402]ULP33434.1 hypothetical protein MCP04_30355 [Leptolyngbya boryana IU 594]
MIIIRPRLTDYYNIDATQEKLDFAIPCLDEDIPLYVDPFLLWKSPSQQDNALHTALVNAFNHLNFLIRKGKRDQARNNLILASECREVGLGLSKKRKGLRIGADKADEILFIFESIPEYERYGFLHFEEIQLYVDGIAKDRISDISCNLIKSFLIDFTIQQAEDIGIPIEKTILPSLYDYKTNSFLAEQAVSLPLHPETKDPLIFVPKRWLRFSPWINFEDYFKDYCPYDEIFSQGEPKDRVKVLNFNRENYGVVKSYIEAKTRTQADCKNDPLFAQIPVLSAKRKLSEIKKLPTGKENRADEMYEKYICQLLASLLYPELDFAAEQSRTESGTLIRDLIFYNNRSVDFLKEISEDYGNRQLVFELKNVKAIERDHINQLNRYLDSGLGKFGVLVTRHRLPKAMFKNTIDLWSGQRRCIIALTDEDIELMVNIFESKQRSPIDVLKKKYLEFRRACPS